MAPVGRRTGLEHHVGDLRGLSLAPFIVGMNCGATQGDHSSRVETADDRVSLVRVEAALKSSSGVGQLASLKQLPPPPRLEEVQRPSLSVALRGRDALEDQSYQFVEAIDRGQQFATPLVRDTLSRRLTRTKSLPHSGLVQPQRAIEPTLDVEESRVGERQDRRGGRVARGGDHLPRVRERRSCLLRSPRLDQIVGQPREVPDPVPGGQVWQH